MKKELTFNEKYHSYFLGNLFIPGVSSILKSAALVDFSGIPQDIMERAAAFGKAVHKACELDDTGSLDFSSVDEAVIPCLEAWRKFKVDNKVDVEEIEMPVYSEKWIYAGTLDRVIEMNGKRFLLDIKTSKTVYPSMKVQLAGYKLAFEELHKVKINGRMIVRLLRDGTYDVVVCDDPLDEQVFLACLQVYKFKKREKDYYAKKK